jgi:flagellar biosynthesis regulator FlbT
MFQHHEAIIRQILTEGTTTLHGLYFIINMHLLHDVVFENVRPHFLHVI